MPKKTDSKNEYEYESIEDESKIDAKLKKVKEELKNCLAEKKEYLEGWQRSKADFVNLQKSVDYDKLRFKRLGVEGVVLELLPTLDSFEMAFKDEDAWKKVDSNFHIG